MKRSTLSKAIDAQSGIVNITSAPFAMPGDTGFAVQWNITGAAVAGTMKVQGSIDNVNYGDISSAPAAAAGSFFSNHTDIHYPFVRLFWDKGTSTAATVTALINSKG